MDLVMRTHLPGLQPISSTVRYGRFACVVRNQTTIVAEITSVPRIVAGGSCTSTQQSRTVLHPHLLLLGQPDRSDFGSLRTFVVAGSNHPNHTVATRAGLLSVAQRQRTPSRRPRRPTPRTSTRPQRTPPHLGTTRSLNKPATYVVTALARTRPMAVRPPSPARMSRTAPDQNPDRPLAGLCPA
jgi:hypothetical protein